MFILGHVWGYKTLENFVRYLRYLILPSSSLAFQVELLSTSIILATTFDRTEAAKSSSVSEVLKSSLKFSPPLLRDPTRSTVKAEERPPL